MANVKRKMANVKLIQTIAMEVTKVVYVVVVTTDGAVSPKNLHQNWNLETSTGIVTVDIHSVLMQAPRPTRHLMLLRSNASNWLIIAKVRDYRISGKLTTTV